MGNPFCVVGARIIDGKGTAPYVGSVGVQDGRIVFVERGDLLPPGFEPVRASGFTLMPGLIDCHVHLAAPPDPGTHEPYWKTVTPPAGKTLALLFAAQNTLKAGFTTVRNCGAVSWGTPEDLFVRDAIQGGYFPGPGILACGGALSVTGGHGDRAFPAFLPHDPAAGFGENPCDGVESCVREVRRRVKLGADFIKIYSTGGVSTPGDGSDSLDFSRDETRAIVKEALKHGKRVATHAQGLEGIRIAVEAGVSTVEHGSWLDRETAVEMARKGISLVTTIGIFRAILDKGESYPNPSAMAKARKIIEAQSRMLKLARETGINLAMGTDASMSLRNGDNAREFLALSAEGLTSEEILRMATLNGARALGLEDRIGSLEPGKNADFLLVCGNPLEDISCLTRKPCIRAVTREGRFLCMRSSTGEEMLSGAFSSDLVNEVLAG